PLEDQPNWNYEGPGKQKPQHPKNFIWLAGYLIGRGMLWGNIIGIAFIVIQKNFQIFHLDQQSYYLSYVPVKFNLSHILLLNVGTLFICITMMIVPTMI